MYSCSYIHIKTSVVRVNDPEDAADRAEPAEESSHHSGLDKVDSKVTEFISAYRDSSSIDSFMDSHNMLKSDATDNMLTIDYCHPTNTICMGTTSSYGPCTGPKGSGLSGWILVHGTGRSA